MHACMKQSVSRSCDIILLVFFLEWNVISTPFGVRVVISLPYDDMAKLNNNNSSLCLCWAQLALFWGRILPLIAYSCCGAMFPCWSSTSRKAHVSSMTIVSMLVVNYYLLKWERGDCTYVQCRISTQLTDTHNIHIHIKFHGWLLWFYIWPTSLPDGDGSHLSSRWTAPVWAHSDFDPAVQNWLLCGVA